MFLEDVLAWILWLLVAAGAWQVGSWILSWFPLGVCI